MTSARSYFRIMLGAKSSFAEQCISEGWFGGGWDINQDLTNELGDNWRDFNKRFIPVYLEANPSKSRVAAGLGCGMLHTICKGILQGDLVFCPDGSGHYIVGEVSSDYQYVPDQHLPHRRSVAWYPKRIARADMSEALQRSTGSIGTLSNITQYADELESLLTGNTVVKIFSTDELIEDPSTFALEKHLEDFLVQNWSSTALGQDFDLFTEEGEVVGRQYPTDTGPLDLLAISKDKRTLLVVELKKGRASDAVVGQIQRYMGYVLDELAESHQTVKGCIIALDDDLHIKRALRVTSNIDFYRYQIDFKLFKV
jgi:restriction system protein